MSHDRQHLEIEPWTLIEPPPGVDPQVSHYLYNELRRIQLTIDHLVEAAPQATDKVPDSPREGTIRWNLQPWDPLSDGLEGFVQYNGSVWAALAARA